MHEHQHQAPGIESVRHEQAATDSRQQMLYIHLFRRLPMQATNPVLHFRKPIEILPAEAENRSTSHFLSMEIYSVPSALFHDSYTSLENWRLFQIRSSAPLPQIPKECTTTDN